jgi:hypothetical protein
MSAYIQIAGDPTKWWPANPFQASQLTGQPLSIPVTAPAYATLVLSGKSESVAVFEVSQAAPDGLELQVPSIYVATAAGLSAGHAGYELPTDVNLTNLGNQIMTSMRNGHSQAITLSFGGTLVINGATLSFAVLVAPIVLGIGGGTMPHD